jgi:hypothetical protein
MQHPAAKTRLFGITSTAYRGMNLARQDQARKDAIEKLEERFAEIFQRRHDCIHNCDRPKVRPQSLARRGTVFKVIEDVEFLVHRCDEHINSEFKQFLSTIGCAAATIAAAGY